MEKAERGRRTPKIYAVLPIISGTLKVMNFKFGRTFAGSLRAKGC